MGREVPSDVSIDKSSKDIRVCPYLLEAHDQLLSLLLVSFLSEYFLVRLHDTLDCVSPCMPEDRS